MQFIYVLLGWEGSASDSRVLRNAIHRPLVRGLKALLKLGGGATSTPTSKGGKKRAKASDLASMADSFATLVEKAHTSMNELSKRIGYAQDISQARKNMFAELRKLPLQSNDRLRATDEIVKNDKRVDLFFNLPDDHKMEFVCMVLTGILAP
ncbi:hypothetical protein Acr_18g0003800 [Actinidia rufa]|uniref:Uncharacterized protein n=1 Tax=Actinidia rufa TaxID=165716 RepID=A0A7J0G5Z9_9ERIC|nr:hypothetical protein Acr_18g0003800 [Actinidia rufa]